MSTPIENNTEGLLEILQTVNNLPEAGSGVRNQDITITENGTYTAEEGYTGLGTVTVEVAGGTGGDSGGDIIQLPSADDSYFGDEEGEITVTSGYYYGAIEEILPPIPDGYEKNYPYALVYTDYSQRKLMLSSKPLLFQSGATGHYSIYLNASSIEPPGFLVFTFDRTTSQWGSRESHIASESGSTNEFTLSADLSWANHTVYKLYDSSTIMLSSSEPVPASSENKAIITIETADETYTISGTVVSGLLSSAKRVSGSSDPMTPSQAIDTLDEYYANPAEEMKF